LIINTLAVDSQLRYIQNKNLGFEKNNLIYIPIKHNLARNYGILKQKLLNDSNVDSVTAVHYLFPFVFPRTTAYDWEGKTPGQDSDMLINAVDYDFFKTLNINILSGRSFSKTHANDKTGAYILNEAAVDKMGIDSPVGKRFSYHQRKGTIIGVMENVYFKSLHQRIEPQVFLVSEDFSEATQYGAVLINPRKGRTSEALEVIKKTWGSINPNLPFEYHFLDQAYANLYRGEKTIRSLLNYFALLAILVSCLGLAGLASFMSRQKTKEIGVRKVCGASLNKIVRLIVFQYIKWVILAIVIAWPVSYLIMGQWLKQFAYRFTPGPVIFLLSALAVILFALVTVGYQAFKAASANPVEALRHE
jgi:ABC-type antimicrobial peptide transport system permease subunit